MISSNHHERGKRGALGNFVIIITLMTRGGKEGHWGNGGCKCNCVSTAPHSLSISKFSKIEKKVRETKADTQKRLILHLKVLFSKIEKKVETNKQMHKDKREKRRDNQTHLDKSRHTHRRSFPTSKSHTYKDTHTHKRSHLAIMTLPHNSAGVGVHNAGERRLCREKMIN